MGMYKAEMELAQSCDQSHQVVIVDGPLEDIRYEQTSAYFTAIFKVVKTIYHSDVSTYI